MCQPRKPRDPQIQWRGGLTCFGLKVNSFCPGCLTPGLGSSARGSSGLSASLLWRLHVTGFSPPQGAHRSLSSLFYMCCYGHDGLFYLPSLVGLEEGPHWGRDAVCSQMEQLQLLQLDVWSTRDHTQVFHSNLMAFFLWGWERLERRKNSYN